MPMNQIIPILPCPSIKEQVAFYESLGFTAVQITNRPNPYAVVRYGALEVHFYGTKRMLPNQNPTMCYVKVDDVERVYSAFSAGLKEKLGKLPRSGIPRISKLKDLTDDRRFMVTDLGGNTLFIGTPNAGVSAAVFYRTLESPEFAAHFEILYDLIYSKEDPDSANNMLVKFFPTDLASLNVGASDQAKILLAALDLHLHREGTIHQPMHDKLTRLLNDCDAQNADWAKIRQKFHDILGGE